MSEIEARIARRLAIAFWKGERAERIEVALFDAAPKLRPPQAGYQWEQADPLTTFDLKRFNAVRGYQAQQGREISRCLKELRQLRKEALAECTDEPEAHAGKRTREPQPPANDDAPEPAERAVPTPQEPSRNEPERPLDGWEGCGLTDATRAELNRLLAADDWEGLARLAATGALAPLGMGPDDLASPRALGRFLFPPRAVGATAA